MAKMAEPELPPDEEPDDHSEVYYVPYDHPMFNNPDPDPHLVVTNGSLPANATDLWEANRQRALELVPVLALLALLLLLSVVGNSLVCLLYRTRFRRNTTSLFVVFLAGLDLVFQTLGVAMEAAVMALPLLYTSAAACKVARYVETTSVSVTLLALAGVAADRYCKLCRPVDCLPLRRARWYCALAVLLALGLAVPACFVFGVRSVTIPQHHPHPPLTGSACGTDDAALDSPMRIVYVGLLLLTFTCAILTMGVLYALILVRIYRRKASSSRGERISPARKDYPRKHRFVTEDSTSSCGGGEEGRRLPSASCSSAGSSTAGGGGGGGGPCTTPKQGRTSPAAGDPARVPLKPGVKESARIGRGGSTTVDVQSTRMTTIFFAVSVLCAICLLPFLLMRLLRATTHVLDNLQAPAALVLYEVAVRSYLLHAPLKPLVYLVLNHSFRRECRHLVLKLWAFCAGNSASSASPPH